MDWKPYLPGLFAILGSVVTGGIMLGGQIITQAYENERHMNRLIYEMTLEEWKMKRSEAISFNEKYKVQAYTPEIRDLLVPNLVLGHFVLHLNSLPRKDEDFSKFFSLIKQETRQRFEEARKNIREKIEPRIKGDGSQADNAADDHAKNSPNP